MGNPRDDQRSIEDLVNAALCETDEDAVWDCIAALHWRGTVEVLLRAAALGSSPCARERQLAADIVGQLGLPDRTFPAESADVLWGILTQEQDAGVLRAILIAFSHLKDPKIIEVAHTYVRHPDPDVRHAAVHALTGYDDPRAIDFLIELTKDSETHVRDWATFGLGTQLDVDTPQIRAALFERLTDTDDITRAEAQVGLARRGDQRVVAFLAPALTAPSVGSLSLEAAEAIASPALRQHLIALRGRSDIKPTLLQSAIDACTLST